MKIILLTNGRPELTKQTIDTMKGNAANWAAHELLIVYDGDYFEESCKRIRDLLGPTIEVYATGSQLGVGGAKNFGVECLENFNNGLDTTDIIMFSDNDMYYLFDWDIRLDNLNPFKQLGGWKHPYHALGAYVGSVTVPRSDDYEVDAVTGNCFVIKYSDWQKYGPFNANALGPGQSEDFALSQKIKQDGGLVGTTLPSVTIHCGLANCLGEPATGYQEMSQMVEEQLKQYNINSIWLDTPTEGTIFIEKHTEGIAQLEEQQPPKLSGVGSNPTSLANFSALNIGSGQRRFDNNCGWINVDCVSRPPDQIPDVVIDAHKLVEQFGENTQDMVVLHHILEHFGCGEADEVLKQCFKVLKSGGSLLVFVPDLRKLAGRWLSGELDDFSYLVNIYGAFQGLDGDRHKWGYDKDSLFKYLKTIPGTGRIKDFDWREISGADIAKDWWILGMEVVKE